MSEPTFKLQRNAEQLLREFPASEPDFDAQAQAIEARLKGSADGEPLRDLLKAPELLAEPGEPAPPSSVHAAPAAKSNFAEIARRSLRKEDDSAELAKELLAATAQRRRPDAEMVERVRAAGRPPASSSPLPTTAPEDAQRASGVIARAATSVPPSATANQRGRVIGVAGGLLALAACVALFLKSGGGEQLPAPAPIAAHKANAAAATAAADAAAAAAVAKMNEGVVSPEALAAAPPATVHEDAKGVAPKAGAAISGAKAASASPDAPPAVVLNDDPTPPEALAKNKTKPGTEPALTPAEGHSGSVPLNPSGGAVGTALGSVRSGAQACLAGQTTPVTATVTFASDGHVLQVSAAGPSGACIQAALSKAHIAPFAKESFTATTTIRPP